jgi:cytochrome c-type biogenesis protein CcmH
MLLAALLAGGPIAARVAQDDYEIAISTIRCDCGCHPQSVKDCACGRAAEMRAELQALVDQGMTGEAIVARYVEEHGEQILISPEATGFNLVAWLGPLVGLVAATLLLSLLLRKWMRQRGPDPAAAVVIGPGAEDPYLDRLQERLREME